MRWTRPSSTQPSPCSSSRSRSWPSTGADYAAQANGLASGSISQGQGWQLTANTANADGEKVGAVKPDQGATGWSDTWMIAKDTPNINCAYKWADYVVSPRSTLRSREYFGEAPANEKSCQETSNKDHCDQFHASERLLDQRLLLDDSHRKCLDGRTDVTCIPYKDWVTSWTTPAFGLT